MPYTAAEVESNSQLQWWLARKLYYCHHDESLNMMMPGEGWVSVPTAEKYVWRSIALLGMALGWEPTRIASPPVGNV